MKRLLGVILAALFFLSVTIAPENSYALDELKNTDPDKYYILLDLRNQFVTVYEKDEAGEYTRIVRRFLCTTGSTEPEDPEDPEDIGTPTPTGIWKIGGRERFGKFANYGSEYARYWVQIVGSVYFHSIMFNKRSVDSMQSGAFRRLGTNVSHGCVRLYVEDAKWLYYYACPGTVVEVSDNEPRQRDVAKALKTSLSFKEYNALQMGFYDEEPLENPSCIVTVEGARARKGCGRDYSTVFRPEVGEKLEVLQINEAWVKVSNGKREGYILRGYVTFNEDGSPDTVEDATLIRSTVWMYENPAVVTAERICKVPTDTSVLVLETVDKTWVKIQYLNEVGYIKASSLRTGWGKKLT
ncbi:MAG: L,D-transpeptidase family protein [Clostridia bacterium]|nr:L,D-transpeptidase family protein [Clostridia bacterium]